MFKRIKVLVVTSLLATGCAKAPDKIQATYVSPMVYSSYNCNQLGEETARIARRVSEVSGAQQGNATRDNVAMGVGLVIFWPSLFFLAGDDKKEELARLKGEYEAVERAGIMKECTNIATMINEEKRRAEEVRQRKEAEDAAEAKKYQMP